MKTLSRNVAPKLEAILYVCRLSRDIVRHNFVVKCKYPFNGRWSLLLEGRGIESGEFEQKMFPVSML
jgi:hypothetical protein